MLTETSLLIDIAYMVFTGLIDFRKFEVNSLTLIAGLSAVSFVYFSLIHIYGAVVFIGFTCSVFTGLFLILYLFNQVGSADFLVFIRIPVVLYFSVFLNKVLWLMVFTFTLLAVAFTYQALYVKPVLCGKKLVKREHFLKPNVIPTGVKLDVENNELLLIKKKILMETRSKCIEATVGQPLVFLFSIPYSLFIALSLLL